MKLSHWLTSSAVAFASLLYATNASAEVYTTLEGTFNDIEIGDTNFHPLGVDARLGVYIIQGLALEAHLGYGLLSGNEDDMDLSLLYNAGLQSRVILMDDRGSTLFVLGGYSLSWLDLDRNETGLPGEELLTGISYGVGFDIKLGGQSSNVYWSAKGVRYYKTDDISIDTYSTGLRYTF